MTATRAEARKLLDRLKAAKAAVSVEIDGTGPLSIELKTALEGVPESQIDDVRQPFQDRFAKVMEARTEADKAFFMAAFDLKPRRGKREVRDVHYTSTYSSQGFGALKYTKGAAELQQTTWEAAGLEVTIEDVEWSDGHRSDLTGKIMGLAVVTHVQTELDEEITRRKTLDLREQVRLSWKKGVNPRVSMPFLPHGYEEKEGLDYFGNDLRESKS